jgi:hypothetical protein
MLTPDGMQRFPYAGASDVVKLRGPAGQIITLNGDGPNTLQWAPDDKRAMELEFRMLIVDWQRPGVGSAAPPNLYWSLTFGHGQMTWYNPTAPAPALAALAGFFKPNLLPQRGLVLRLPARELKFTMRALERQTDPPQPAPDFTKIQVSVQPIVGMQTPVLPKQHGFYAPLLALAETTVQTFPAEATEFRVFDISGRPFTLGVLTLSFANLNSGTVGAPQDASLYATFQPIPVFAAEWFAGFTGVGPTGYVFAEFR